MEWAKSRPQRPFVRPAELLFLHKLFILHVKNATFNFYLLKIVVQYGPWAKKIPHHWIKDYPVRPTLRKLEPEFDTAFVYLFQQN